MAGRIVLIRHGAPEVLAGVASSQWRLSEAGGAAARALAGRLGGFSADAVWSSPELKALETATAIAGELGLPVREAVDLREHERGSLGYLTRDALEAGVERLLRSDDEAVFGDETAGAVFRRMRRALAAAGEATGGGDVLAVTHGTAATIFVARRCGVEPVAFWRALSLPAAIVVDGERLVGVLQ
jgi:broad specificity phosphatase PhoE